MEKIKIEGRELNLKFSALAPVKHSELFEQGLVPIIQDMTTEVMIFQEKIKSFKADDVKDINYIQQEANELRNKLLQIAYVINFTAADDIYSFISFESWRKNFKDEADLFNCCWFSELVSMLVESYLPKGDDN